METYSALAAMVIQLTASAKESSLRTDIWKNRKSAERRSYWEPWYLNNNLRLVYDSR